MPRQRPRIAELAGIVVEHSTLEDSASFGGRLTRLPCPGQSGYSKSPCLCPAHARVGSHPEERINEIRYGSIVTLVSDAARKTRHSQPGQSYRLAVPSDVAYPDRGQLLVSKLAWPEPTEMGPALQQSV